MIATKTCALYFETDNNTDIFFWVILFYFSIINFLFSFFVCLCSQPVNTAQDVKIFAFYIFTYNCLQTNQLFFVFNSNYRMFDLLTREKCFQQFFTFSATLFFISFLSFSFLLVTKFIFLFFFSKIWQKCTIKTVHKKVNT